ncbi:MAG: hypothetical protein KY455_08915 [Euryarchaeota archaeon]|nr:hypothetical protein [Euryarchaeota archaeon]
MQPRTALTLALVAGGLAVGLVAADLAWTLTAQVDGRTETGWQTVTRSDDRSVYEHGPRPVVEECLVVDRDARLVVDNDKPLPDTVEVFVGFYNQTSDRQERILEATWSLSAFEVREVVFRVPSAAIPSDDRADDQPPYGKTGHLEVRVGDHYVTACVEEGS